MAAHPESASPEYETILSDVFPLGDKVLDKVFEAESDKFADTLASEALKAYEQKEKSFGAEEIRKIERDIYLQVLDELWMQHLESMEHLREGIHWVGIGQRDPLVEYRRRGQVMFDTLQLALRHETVRNILHAEPLSEMDLARAVETELTLAAKSSVNNSNQITRAEEFEDKDLLSPTGAKPSARKKSVIKKTRKKERQQKKAGKKNRRRK
jgi:preprotein translocase subunit SecA